ncbi:prepilin peptidase [Alkaliphilus serpentinus]|uniref:Prepilin leader peptidase/N-methyltransferase n=1 Tax=Alkaliphilus serpentinus TaxID=1482731 RepID=A0A833HMG6_9FIRM|nr:A24 family peptidase [Alkaliphilus serpentinus]KAB3527590.1 prepilin peptidase [Alkaliphilus serpentinus]
MNYLLIFTIGLVIGSFLNVCIYRIPEEKSIVFPPSHCTQCKTSLKAIDLIPIISFIIYRGRCRYCGEKISLQYPIVESMNGLMYVLLFMKFGFSIEFLQYALLISGLIVIFMIDYYHQIIPDGLNIFIFVLAMIFIGSKNLATHSFPLSNFLGLLVAGGFFLLIAVLTNGAMGGGDIKLMAALGFWFGLMEVILIIFLSFIIGGILSSMLVLLRMKGRKDYIPFGPFIVIATTIVTFFGKELLQWYLSII